MSDEERTTMIEFDANDEELLDIKAIKELANEKKKSKEKKTKKNDVEKSNEDDNDIGEQLKKIDEFFKESQKEHKQKTEEIQMKEIRQPIDIDNIIAREMKTTKKQHGFLTPETRNLVLTLHRYGTSLRFGDYLQKTMKIDLSLPTLSSYTAEELTRLLDDVKIIVANKNNNSMVGSMLINGVNVAEKFISNFINIKGTAKVLMSNESFLDTLEEWQLENSQITTLSARNRVLVEVLKTSLAVYNMNDSIERLKKENPEEFKKMAIQFQEHQKQEQKDSTEKKTETNERKLDSSIITNYKDVLEYN